MSIFRISALNPAVLSFATTAALGLATFTFVMPAHAATPATASASAATPFERLEGELPAIRVSYADLDLNTEQGRHVMQKRLAAAARIVCDDATNITNPLKARAVYEQCHDEALERATSYFAAKMKERKLAQR